MAVDEVFFTKYFNQIASNKSAFRKKKVRNARRDDGDEEDEGDSEAKSEIRRAMVGSRPDIKQGDVGFDDGDDIAGLSDISDDSDENIQDIAEDDDIGDGEGEENAEDEMEPHRRSPRKVFEAGLENCDGEG